MVNEVFTNLENVRLVWVGMAKPNKETKVSKHQIEIMTVAPNGQELPLFISQDNPFDAGLKAGERYNFSLKMRTFNGGLFFDMMGFSPVLAPAGKMKV